MTWATWIIAVLCAVAVGARIGRLTVRPPSLARTSVAIAAVATAVAAAVRTPTVAVVLGPAGSDTPVLIFVGCWVVVATATALIAASASPRVGRHVLHSATVAIPTVAVAVVVAMAVTGSTAAGSLFVVLAGVFSLVVGIRYIAWHPLGRAIACYLAGVLVVIIIIAIERDQIVPANGWWAVAIIVLSVACASVMVESWFVARQDLRRTDGLWQELRQAHPELDDGDYRSATTVLRADDRVSTILDGLYLHAGAGMFDPGPAGGDSDGGDSSSDESGGGDPRGPEARAAAIAQWLHRGFHDDGPSAYDTASLATPLDLSDRRWVRLIAREYQRTRG
ncbi:hypothetical protein [Gordonia zhaorongruii]|uniref:hypothetical protein n=1 Tax=Gordonia zhaorongruii TaxID=2597659 RepID=UPI00118149D1|nr:hypothetical protein [Gordonia zhaorongruii]